jgi:tetratricopeptide (TPR) repeat protein
MGMVAGGVKPQRTQGSTGDSPWHRRSFRARVDWPMAAVIAWLLCGPSSAQDTGRTVRHHKVAVEDQSFPPALVEAEADIGKKDFSGAEPLLKSVVEHDAGNFQAWFDLGFVYNALGRADDSIAAYRKSVAAKPDVFESNLNLGLMLAKSGQPDAEQFLRAATHLKPTSDAEEGATRAWMGLAHAIEGSKPDEALEAYRQAEVLQPKNTEPHLSAGLLLEKQNRFADAEQEYKNGLVADPASADALTGLANLYMRGHLYGQAEEVLRKLLALHPDDPGGHMQLGRLLAVDGKNDAAVAELQTALKLAPGDAGGQRDLADLYATTGKFDQAEMLYRALVGADQKNAEFHYGLGRALLKEHKFPEAQEQFLITVKLKPDWGVAYGELAAAANENQNYQLAIAALDARAKLLPEPPIGYFLRGTAYDHLRDAKDAALNYHKFLEVANGQFPDQEWQARHRLIAIEPKK